MNSTKLLVVGVFLALIILGVVQLFSPRSAISPSLPVATSTPVEQTSATTTPITTATVSITKKSIADSLPIIAGDTITSWSFVSAYANNSELVAKTYAEISRLLALIGKGTFSDMSLYVAVANQYELLGEGKQEYDYLILAVKAGGATSGLPWHNLGVLMERLGALQTARVAYEESTTVQPELKQWHYAYLEFLITRMSDDTVGIEKAFATAQKYIPNDTDILQLRSEWQKS